MRSRYVYATHPGGTEFEDNTSAVSAATIDAAIRVARDLSVSRRSPVQVVDRSDSTAHVVRGVAMDGVWRWTKACASCGGSRTQTMKGAGKSIPITCPKCEGRGWRVAI